MCSQAFTHTHTHVIKDVLLVLATIEIDSEKIQTKFKLSGRDYFRLDRKNAYVHHSAYSYRISMVITSRLVLGNLWRVRVCVWVFVGQFKSVFLCVARLSSGNV